jgi:SpoVK/Ycf46/Vps4 family AAA+-type ATPase
MRFTPGVMSHGDALVGQRLTPLVDWHELGAPPDLKAGLEALRAHIVAHRRRAAPSLFVGAPGNGQALAAAALGKATGMAVSRVDLSAVVARYIGETEKQLNRIFTQAERSDLILFFDEADALFGKRSEVHDAHDRYANVEVSYLLQKLEAFNGVAILSTNARANIDPAFLRHLRYVVRFNAPLHPPKRPPGT